MKTVIITINTADVTTMIAVINPFTNRSQIRFHDDNLHHEPIMNKLSTIITYLVNRPQNKYRVVTAILFT